MKKPIDTLVDTQHWMQTVLLAPNTNATAFVNEVVTPSKQLTPEACLAIYQRSYYSRLIECMREQFKALRYTLDDALFDDFVRLYLKTHPSTSPSLADLGKLFPSFLEQTRPDKAEPELWIDFMIAMAQFECDLYAIFDAPGSEGKPIATASTKDEALVLQDCISIHQYPFDVNTYYQEVAKENAPEITPAQTSYICFVRTNYQVYILTLTNYEYSILRNLLAGHTIHKAIEELTTIHKLDNTSAYKVWETAKIRWIDKGLFLEKLLFY